MATFPPYVKLGWRDSVDHPQPVIATAEMEKGPPKSRRVLADARVRFPVTAYFDTQADALAFETWFYDVINGGVLPFDWTNPRLGSVVEAYIENGDIGPLKPSMKTWAMSERSFVLIYMRSAL